MNLCSHSCMSEICYVWSLNLYVVLYLFICTCMVHVCSFINVCSDINVYSDMNIWSFMNVYQLGLDVNL